MTKSSMEPEHETVRLVSSLFGGCGSTRSPGERTKLYCDLPRLAETVRLSRWPGTEGPRTFDVWPLRSHDESAGRDSGR